MWYTLTKVVEQQSPMALFVAQLAYSMTPQSEAEKAPLNMDNVYMLERHGPILGIHENAKEVELSTVIDFGPRPIVINLKVMDTSSGFFVRDDEVEIQMTQFYDSLQKSAMKKYSHINDDIVKIMCRQTSIFEMDFSEMVVDAMNISEPLKAAWKDYIKAKEQLGEITSTW